MAFLAKKINIDMTHGMITLAALYWVESFILYNKHFYFLIKHLGLVTRKVPVVNLKSQLDSVWQYQIVVSFKQLVIENLN